MHTRTHMSVFSNLRCVVSDVSCVSECAGDVIVSWILIDLNLMKTLVARLHAGRE